MGDPDHEHDDGWTGPPLPPDDRLWRHPSEFGRHAAATPPVSAPPRRSTFGWALAGGVAVAVVAVVALEFLGTIGDIDVDTARASVTLTSLSQPALSAVRNEVHEPPGIAWVSVDGSSPSVPGVVLDQAGHVLVSADTFTTTAPDAVSCEGLTSRQIRVVGVDDELGIALLQVESAGWTAAEITTIRPQPGEEIRLVTQTTSGQAAVPGLVKASRSTLAFDAATPLRHPAVVVDASGAVMALIGARHGRSVPTPIADALRAARQLLDSDPTEPTEPTKPTEPTRRSTESTPTTTHR